MNYFAEDEKKLTGTALVQHSIGIEGEDEIADCTRTERRSKIRRIPASPIGDVHPACELVVRTHGLAVTGVRKQVGSRSEFTKPGQERGRYICQ
jgi:hypothetical protein